MLSVAFLCPLVVLVSQCIYEVSESTYARTCQIIENILSRSSGASGWMRNVDALLGDLYGCRSSACRRWCLSHPNSPVAAWIRDSASICSTTLEWSTSADASILLQRSSIDANEAVSNGTIGDPGSCAGAWLRVACLRLRRMTLEFGSTAVPVSSEDGGPFRTTLVGDTAAVCGQ